MIIRMINMKKIRNLILLLLFLFLLIGCTESTSFTTSSNIKTLDDITTTIKDNNTTLPNISTTTIANDITTTIKEITTTTNNPITTTQGKYPKLDRITEDAKLIPLDEFKSEYPGYQIISCRKGFLFKSKDACGVFEYDGNKIERKEFGDYLRDITYDDFFDDYNLLFIVYNHSSSVRDFEYKGYRIEDDTFYNVLDIYSPLGQSQDFKQTYFLFAVNKKFELTKHSVDMSNTFPNLSQQANFPLCFFDLKEFYEIEVIN